MTARDFLVSIPKLCGAKNADRIADIFGYVFDKELAGGSVFDRNEADKENFLNRSICLWDMLYSDEDADPVKVDHCMKLMEIIERSHYLDEHGDKGQATIIDALYQEVKALEISDSDVAAVLTADDAVTMGGWNF